MPRLCEGAISGLYWVIISLIDVSLWLIDTTSQCMARDAQAITFSAFAQTHEPLPELLALPPATVPLAVLPVDFRLWLLPDDSVRRWLNAALPLVIAPFIAEIEAVLVSPAVVPGVPSVTEDAPVVKKTRKSKAMEVTAQDKTPRKRSPKTPTAAAP